MTAATYEGRACRRCGGTARYTSSYKCVVCSLAASRRRYDPARQRERRQVQRALTPTVRGDRFDGAPCSTCGATARYVASKRCVRCAAASSARWYSENGDRARERFGSWYAANSERDRAKSVLWRAANRDRVRALTNRTRARKLNAPGTHTADDRAFVLAAANGRCEYCLRRPATAVDHRMPLALGGTNYLTNLHAVCGTCNSSKGAKHPDDWNRPAQVARDDWAHVECEPLWLPAGGGAAVSLTKSPLVAQTASKS